MTGFVMLMIGLGVCNFVLIVFQLLSGLHLIKVKIGVHKKTGIAIVVISILHGLLGLMSVL